MAKQQPTDYVKLATQMKERGLTCPVLKGDIESSINSAKNFRAFGWEKLAAKQEEIGATQKDLYNHICLLS